MATPAFRGAGPSPPERGSFPLDHLQECAALTKAFLQCLQRNNGVQVRCREEAKKYFQCRMDNGLMAKEEFESLGFGKNESLVDPAEESHKEAEGFVPGMARAREIRKQKGG
eukprot:tig00001355_g8346.t1